MQLARVAAIVDDLVEARVHERDVEAFEVVLDVERPVGVDDEFAVARRIVNHASPGAPWPRLRPHRPRKRRRAPRDRARRRPARPIARRRRCGRLSEGRREIARLLELRHEGHAAREVEAPRVVAAADLLRLARRRAPGCCPDGCRRSTGIAARRRRRAQAAAARRDSRVAGRAARAIPAAATSSRGPSHCHVRAKTRSAHAPICIAHPSRTTRAACDAAAMSASTEYFIPSPSTRARARASRGSWCGRAGRRARSTGCRRA